MLGTYLRELPLPDELNDHPDWVKEWNVAQLDEIRLRHHFGGQDVVYSKTKKGPLILAAGTPEQVRATLDSLQKKERQNLAMVFPKKLQDDLV